MLGKRMSAMGVPAVSDPQADSGMRRETFVVEGHSFEHVMMAQKAHIPDATTRACARASPDTSARKEAFLSAWHSCRKVRPALRQSGVSWHNVNAWRRWDKDFRRRYDETRDDLACLRAVDRTVRSEMNLTRRQFRLVARVRTIPNRVIN